MADEWIQTVVGGVLGGLITSFVPWFKHRDESQQRLRDAYASLFSAVDKSLRRSGPLLWSFHGGTATDPDRPDTYAKLNDLIMEVTDARVRLEMLEDSESCLARVETLREALNGLHDVHVPGMTQSEYAAAYKAATAGVPSGARRIDERSQGLG